MSTAQWDAYISSAPSFAVAQDRMQEAVSAGIDLDDLAKLQASRVSS